MLDAVITSFILSLAGASDIYPTTVTLTESDPIQAVTLTNRTDEAESYEVSAYRWTQEDGENTLTADTNIVVTPPILTIPPGEDRIVRVGVINPPENKNELSYRLEMIEIKNREKLTSGGLQVNLRLLLPVFFLDPEGPDYNLSFSGNIYDDGRFCIEGHNAGATHAKVIGFGEMDVTGSPTTSHLAYLLPDTRMAVCSDKINSQTNDLPVSVQVTDAYEHKIVSIPIQWQQSVNLKDTSEDAL